MQSQTLRQLPTTITQTWERRREPALLPALPLEEEREKSVKLDRQRFEPIIELHIYLVGKRIVSLRDKIAIALNQPDCPHIFVILHTLYAKPGIVGNAKSEIGVLPRCFQINLRLNLP